MTSIDDQQNRCDQTKHVPGRLVMDSHEDWASKTRRILCRELAALEEAIPQRFEDSDNLRNRAQEYLAQLKTYRNESHSLFARTLPVEIIQHIFSLVIVDQAGNSSMKRRNPLRLKALPEKDLCAPVLLLGVCYRWRRIALAQSELWTKIWINVDRELCPKLTEEWLSRSYPRPLNLTIYGNDLEQQTWYSELAWRTWHLVTYTLDSKILNLFGRLQLHSSRFGCINLENAPPMSFYTLFNHANPRLDSFELRIGKYSYARTAFGSGIPLVELAHFYPEYPVQPSRFHSANQDCPIDKMPSSFGWQNLTHLELRYYNPETVLGIIRQAPQLKHCTLRSIPSQQPLQNSNESMKPFLHSCLENLTFNGCGAYFFRNITLTSLKHLKYDLDKWNKTHFDEDLRQLGDLLDRSNPKFPNENETFALAYPHLRVRDSSLDFNHIGRQRFAAAVTHLSFKVKAQSCRYVLLLLKGSDTTVFPNLQEIQLNVFQKNYFSKVPSMGPKLCAALCDLITKNNSNADLEINRESVCSNPTATPVDDAEDHIPQCDTPYAGNPSMNIIPGRHRRPLRSITVFMDCDDSHMPGTIIKMRKDTFWRLQEAQKSGPLTLKFEFRTENNVDILHHPRCLKNDDGDFVTLKSF